MRSRRLMSCCDPIGDRWASGPPERSPDRGRKRCKILAQRVYASPEFLDSVPTPDYTSCFLAEQLSPLGRGGVAQLGERLNGIQEVRGSIPLASTSRRCSLSSVGPPAVRVSTTPVDYWSNGLGANAGIAQLVEHNLAKVGVAGSSPVSRSACRMRTSRASFSSGRNLPQRTSGA